METKQLIDALAPDHDRSSCSDDNPCNAFGYDGESGVFTSSGCTRCSLMRVASGAELPPDFNLRQL